MYTCRALSWSHDAWALIAFSWCLVYYGNIWAYARFLVPFDKLRSEGTIKNRMFCKCVRAQQYMSKRHSELM